MPRFTIPSMAPAAADLDPGSGPGLGGVAAAAGLVVRGDANGPESESE